MGTCTYGLPDMFILRPVALLLWVYISGRTPVPMLQILNVNANHNNDDV